MHESYKLDPKTFSHWCKILGINRRGGISKAAEDLIDDFWIARKVFEMSENEFITQVFLPEKIEVPPEAEEELANSPKLDRYIYKKYGYPIEQLLKAREDHKNQPLVKDKLERIKHLKFKQLAN